jgi:hypothetical protein
LASLLLRIRRFLHDRDDALLRNNLNRSEPVRLTLVAKDPESNPTGSPTLYRTDRGTWVVQGWVITDLAVLAQMVIPAGEGCVEIPDRMIQFFRREFDGVDHG